jgi:hypothetical protein
LSAASKIPGSPPCFGVKMGEHYDHLPSNMLKKNDYEWYLPSDLYVVHTQVIGLGDRPFLSKTPFREVWHSVFQNKVCFTSQPLLTRDLKEPGPLPEKPFFRRLGVICLNKRSFRHAPSLDRYESWMGGKTCSATVTKTERMNA